MSLLAKLQRVYRREGAGGLLWHVRYYLSPLNIGPLKWFASGKVEAAYRRYGKDEKLSREFLEKYVPESHQREKGLILDFGCGRGRYSALLAGAGYRVVAVDPAIPDNRIRVPGISYVRSDDGNLGCLKDGVFQGCVCFQVVTYIKDDAGVFSSVHRALKINGFFILQVVNRDNNITRLRGKTLSSEPHIVRHHYYTREEIAALLEKHGFMVEKTQTERFHFPYLSKYVNYFFEFIAPPGWARFVEQRVPPEYRSVITVTARKR